MDDQRIISRIVGRRLDEEGVSVPLPTSVFNKMGYGIEFDKNGKYEEYKIDFEAIGAHLVEVFKVAKK